jgi:predicted transcriptional regulator
MARPANINDTELEILKVFWRDGELSAREAHNRVGVGLNWSPSTSRTMLERMRTKGLLSRRDVHGMAVYAHIHPKVQILGGLMRRLSDLLEVRGVLPVAAFSGSELLDEDDIAALELALNQEEPTEEGA